MSLRQKLQQGRQKLSRLDWYFCLGVMFLLMVLAGLFSAGWKLHQVLNDANALPLEAVAISGERAFTSDKDIQLALQNLLKRSFFSADVTEVQQALEALPWVYSASVRREWPDKLKIYLQEQQPVAHWNKTEWLNVHGEIFAAPQEPSLQGLPDLAGPTDMAQAVLKSYRQIEELLKINGFSLASLSVSPRHAWVASLSDGIVLELGREDRMARIQRFIYVYPLLAKEKKHVASVDLRYDTGLAVGWEQAQKESR